VIMWVIDHVENKKIIFLLFKTGKTNQLKRNYQNQESLDFFENVSQSVSAH